MSTTFKVIPTKMDDHVNFQNVMEIAQHTMTDFFTYYNVDFNPRFVINLHEMGKEYVKDVDLKSRFLWREDEYVWFMLENCGGGTDSYCDRISRLDYMGSSWVQDSFGSLLTSEQIDWVKKNDIQWSFRRSAGQSGIINLAYGHLAAAVALLTEGIITTTDGAWDESIFPIKPENFLKVYFRPESASDEGSKEWAIRCIKSMVECNF